MTSNGTLDAWVIWVPVIAAAVGGVTGAAASIGGAFIAAWTQRRREEASRRNQEIDAAQMALKEISRHMMRYLVQPGWRPNIEWIDTPRDFAYDVVRFVPDEEAVAEWAAASQEILTANTSLWRLWLWHLIGFGSGDRQRMADRIIAAELRMMAAAEAMRPWKRPSRKREAHTMGERRSG